MRPRFFTLQEANNELPWLRHQLESMKELRAKAAQSSEELQQLTRKAASNGKGEIESKIAQKRSELEQNNSKMAEIINSIQEKGIVLRDPDTGLADFPSLNHKGEVIYLCWLLREDEIRYWHTTDSGFAGRQPL